MSREFVPDYNNIVRTARNLKSDRVPLYEHIISTEVMEKILNREMVPLWEGDKADKKEFFRRYSQFFREMGYDTVSFECCITSVMPGSGALYSNAPGAIANREDFERYPWDEIPDIFFEENAENFRLLGEIMPHDMKAAGGPGNGVFEIVQDIVGYTRLCYMGYEDPELYSDLFRTVGKIMLRIWERFLLEFGDIYALCRFGDDLGFKSQTLLSAADIKGRIIPAYKEIVSLVHRHNKPFLLHSCGNIFGVMDDIIEEAGIDAKHSNEDAIAPFSVWVEKYGDRIGNFGGIDLDILCRDNMAEIRGYVTDVFNHTKGLKGIALGSGNSIPEYVPPEGYLEMIETVRRLRGE